MARFFLQKVTTLTLFRQKIEKVLEFQKVSSGNFLKEMLKTKKATS